MNFTPIGTFGHKAERNFREQMLAAYSGQYRAENGDSVLEWCEQITADVLPSSLSSRAEQESFRDELVERVEASMMRRAT